MVCRWAPRLCALLLGLSACASSGQSKLEAGQKVQSGNRRFDGYFVEVAELRDEVEGLDSDLFAVRAPLVDALDLDPDVPMPELIAAVQKQAEEYKGYGIYLNLRLTPYPPELMYEKGSQDGGDQAAVFKNAVEESADKAMGLYKKFGEQLEQVRMLDGKRSGLAESIDRATGNVDKSLLEEEIVGAGRVLEKSSQKLQRDSRTLAYYLLLLSTAVDSGAYAQRVQKCQEAIAAADDPKPKKPVFGRQAGRQGGRPPPSRPAQGGATTARPSGGTPRPPPPKPGGDFEM